jgi:hypothetical protein
MLKAYPEGVPAAVTASLLPYKTKLNPVLYLHVHLQAKMSSQTVASDNSKKATVSLKSLRQILENLESIIEHLNPKETRTTWNNYYEETILSKTYLDDKKVKEQAKPDNIVLQWPGTTNALPHQKTSCL